MTHQTYDVGQMGGKSFSEEHLRIQILFLNLDVNLKKGELEKYTNDLLLPWRTYIWRQNMSFKWGY